MSNPATPLEVENQQVGVDEHFMNKERKPDEVRRGVALDECIAKKDRAGIESSLLIAVRASDMRVKYSFAIRYVRVAGVLRAVPRPLSGRRARRGHHRKLESLLLSRDRRLSDTALRRHPQ